MKDQSVIPPRAARARAGRPRVGCVGVTLLRVLWALPYELPSVARDRGSLGALDGEVNAHPDQRRVWRVGHGGAPPTRIGWPR